MIWLASNLIGKGAPNSDSNEFIGDKVPLVKTIHRVELKSENACKSEDEVYKVDFIIVLFFQICKINLAKETQMKLRNINFILYNNIWLKVK